MSGLEPKKIADLSNVISKAYSPIFVEECKKYGVNIVHYKTKTHVEYDNFKTIINFVSGEYRFVLGNNSVVINKKEILNLINFNNAKGFAEYYKKISEIFEKVENELKEKKEKEFQETVTSVLWM